jgi:hypothetical protein
MILAGLFVRNMQSFLQVHAFCLRIVCLKQFKNKHHFFVFVIFSPTFKAVTWFVRSSMVDSGMGLIGSDGDSVA